MPKTSHRPRRIAAVLVGAGALSLGAVWTGSAAGVDVPIPGINTDFCKLGLECPPVEKALGDVATLGNQIEQNVIVPLTKDIKEGAGEDVAALLEELGI